MIGTLNIKCNAAHPEMALPALFTFAGSPSSLRIMEVPKKIGKWQITSVRFNALYPDGTIETVNCILVGGVWVGTIDAPSASGTSNDGFTIYADGEDENGNAVTGYVLGKGDIVVLDSTGELHPDPDSAWVKYIDGVPTDIPPDGTMWQDGYDTKIWLDGEERDIGLSRAQLNAELARKQDKLAAAQISAIDSVVDERKTVVKYSDNTTSTFDIYGTLNHDDIYIYTNVYPAEVKIGNGVTAIGTRCFQGNTLLTAIKIPDSVTNIDSSAFVGTGLATIEIPASVKTLQRAFTHNANLTSIVLNEGLETIAGAGVLAQCNRLTTLTIPASVTSIAENAFEYLTNISSVVFKEKTLAQVQAMANYPWGLNATVIKTYNVASQEWVLAQLSALEARIDALEDD